MRIGIVTEMNIFGKVNKDYLNMRTEFVWAWMLDADFIPYSYFDNAEMYCSIMDNYDFLLFIPSKKHPEYLINIKNCPIKCGIMQEGGRYQWLEWETKYQQLYLEILNSIDIVLCHNQSDIIYFKTLTKQPVETLRTYQFINMYANDDNTNQNNIFIGGGFNNWYGGTHSYEAIKDFEWNKIGFPTMGRIQPDEKEIISIKDCRVLYYDYMSVKDFINVLKNYKYTIHLMPISAAASFTLGTAIAGGLSVGNVENDTNRLLFPELCIDLSKPNFIDDAKNNIERLKNDIGFYKKCYSYMQEMLPYFNAEKQKELLQKQFRRYINVN